MTVKILRSVATTLSIAALLSLLTYDGTTAKSYTLWVVIYTLIQFFCHAIYTTCSDYFLVKKLSSQAIEQYNKQLQTTVTLACPCPRKNQQSTSIIFGEKNAYKCDACNKTININIGIDNALATTPVDIAIADANKLVNSFQNELKLND